MTPALLTLVCLLATGATHDTRLDVPEASVSPAPSKASRLELQPGETPVAMAVWPLGPEVAVSVRAADGASRLVFWRIGEAKPSGAWQAPTGTSLEAVAWHPASRKVFVLTHQGRRWGISALEPVKGGTFRQQEVHSTDRELKGLIVGPRPFAFYQGQQVRDFRLFFGVRYGSGFGIHTLMEKGSREYLVLGPAKQALPARGMDEYEVPQPIDVPSALPLAVHPSGRRLLYAEDAGRVRLAYYAPGWQAMEQEALPGTAVAFLPNGLGQLLWEPGKPGAQAQVSLEPKPQLLAQSQNFLVPPALTADGRGLVGVVGGERPAVIFEPVQLPLADVSNAWLAVKSKAELEKFGRYAGAFVPTKNAQLYSLYEEELYHDDSTQSVPYLVTTDAFWELFAAAYEGSFILAERYEAMPRFWEFVRAAAPALKKADPKWGAVFTALESLRAERTPTNPEAKKILAAQGTEPSPALGDSFDYSELKPRGHYTASDDLKRYFQAMHYLTTVSKQLDVKALEALPAPTQALAQAWISAYEGYIAPARSPLIWSKGAFTPPPYLRNPGTKPVLFPLSWGFDNEAMFTDVFHCATPLAERIQGPPRQGAKVDPQLLEAAAQCPERAPGPMVPRLLPSGLDVAAAMGSQWARGRMAQELEQFPPLGKALDALSTRFSQHLAAQGPANLYDRWLRALALQWADDVAPPPGVNGELWKAKRLQTGLASWATLRHATVLVNERSAAELGAGGEFEEIFPEQPRGYVEPDPRTFEAIAQLFESSAETFRRASAGLGARKFDSPVEQDREQVREGVLKRLASSAAAARSFKAMAEKQLRGEALKPQEYDQILYVGRNFEHNYLVFKSLGNPKLALSEPTPLPKIADVADGGPKPLLHAAVGTPLEWKLVIPHLGRRQIVRGAVYAYYELIHDEPLSDAEWQQREARTPRPSWLAPFVAKP